MEGSVRSPARKVMGFGFITGYAWSIPTYPVYVGCGPGRFKRTELHEGVNGSLQKRRLPWRAMGVKLLFEFNKRKEVIQCRVGPWRWWWEADAEPAVSEQFRAGWLHPATRKLRKLANGAASFPVGTRPGASCPTRPTISKLTEGRGNAAFFVFGGRAPTCGQVVNALI